MTVVDGEWIKARLPDKRGEKAKLARAMGITMPKLARILSGERNVQPGEVAPVLQFFGETLGGPARAEAHTALMDLVAEELPYLDAEDRAAVATMVRALARAKRGADEPIPEPE